MSERCEPHGTGFFPRSETASCRVETRGGTVYWLSNADEEDRRWVIREQLQSLHTETMVMQRSPDPSNPATAPDLGDKFRGRLVEDIQKDKPLVLELTEDGSRIHSEIVVEIEAGSVPEMLFR